MNKLKGLMRIFMKIIASVTLTVAFFLAAGGSACAWSTYRHAYNESSVPVNLRASCSAGNLYFEGCGKNQCTLNPGTNVSTQFTEDGGESKGTLCMNLNDAIDRPYCVYFYSTRSFWGKHGVRFQLDSGEISNKWGHRVRLLFNNPADGDIKILNTPKNN